MASRAGDEAEVGRLAIAWHRADMAQLEAEDALPKVPDNAPKALKEWKRLAKVAGDAWDDFQAFLARVVAEIDGE